MFVSARGALGPCLILGVFASAVVVGAPARAQQTPAGQVTFATGEARLAAQVGQPALPLKKGDTVYVGQVIETADAAHVHMRLVDGAFLSVRPKSRLRVEAYDYNPAAPEASRVKYTLEDGIARSITGRAGQANKAGFRFNTPVAAIGIRGTDFVVQTTASVSRAAVNSGRIVMSGFGDSCSPGALGPCGNGVAELGVREGVRNNQYLEVRNNQVQPVLMPAQPGSDVFLPKRDNGSAPAEGAGQGTGNAEARASASAAEVLPQAVAKEVASLSGLLNSGVVWGRWSVYEGGSPERPTAEDLLARNDLSVSQVNTGFALFTQNAPLSMPETGRFSMRVVDAEAYIQSGRQLELAKVTKGSLEVNFYDRTFSTGLNVSSGSLPAALNLQAAGAIARDGTFSSGAGNMDVRGAFQGDASQAGYLFRSLLDSGRVAIGAVRWIR